MKFNIEVDEFWIEEEELSDVLSSHIKREVVGEISVKIKEKVDEQVTKKINEVIDKKLSLIIDNALTDLVATGVITYNRQEVTIVQHVKNLFQQNNGWSNPTRQMEAIAKKFGEELKLQYNNVFANKIVQNMKKQGLLKDEVVQILLGGK